MSPHPTVITGRVFIDTGTYYGLADRQDTNHAAATAIAQRSEEHTSELQSQSNLVCRLLLEKKKYSESTAMTATAPSYWSVGMTHPPRSTQFPPRADRRPFSKSTRITAVARDMRQDAMSHS